MGNGHGGGVGVRGVGGGQGFEGVGFARGGGCWG